MILVLFDRKIKIQTGVKSQTVNICTKENILGKYEYKERLHPPFFVEPDNLVEKRFGNIQEIVTYLQDQHNRTIEISPSDSFVPDKLHTANWLYSFLEKLEHKYYITKSEQIIKQYPSKIELVSPGGFPPGITPENILWKQHPRNRLIAEVFARCGMVERSGQGANRMFQLCARESKQPPDYSGTDDYEVFLTVLPWNR